MKWLVLQCHEDAKQTEPQQWKINYAGSDNFKDDNSTFLACVILLKILIWNEHRFKNN